MKPDEAPARAEAPATADTQVAETKTSGPAATPADPTATGPAPDAGATEAQPADEAAGKGADEKDAAEAADGERRKDAGPAARRGRRAVYGTGVAHIRSTFNNTMVSISDARGGMVSWSSAGRAGFKGSRKSTAFAATMVGQNAGRQAVAKGMHEVEVHVQGAGSGRESAVRALQSAGLVVTLIKDVTPMPHNGCRQRKRRRV